MLRRPGLTRSENIELKLTDLMNGTINDFRHPEALQAPQFASVLYRVSCEQCESLQGQIH